VKRRIAIIAAFVLAALGAVAIRVVASGRAALRAGDKAAAICNPMYDARPARVSPPDPRPCLAAIDAYETAARWYLPLAPHVDDAYLGLRYIAGSPEVDPATSLAAWRAIRSAAHATRSLWTPHTADLADADAAIARLSAQDPGAGKLDEKDAGTATPDEKSREAWHRGRLAREVRPAVGAAAIAGLGILLWLAGVISLVRRGIDRTGAWLRRPAVLSGAAIVVGLVLWFVGLANA